MLTPQEDSDPMSKPGELSAPPRSGDKSGGFGPTQEQIDALARRLMPEIKRFFADEYIQQDFARCQEDQKTAE